MRQLNQVKDLENAFDGNVSSHGISWNGGDVGKPATMVLKKETAEITGLHVMFHIASDSNRACEECGETEICHR